MSLFKYLIEEKNTIQMTVLIRDKKQRSHELNPVETKVGMISWTKIGDSLASSQVFTTLKLVNCMFICEGKKKLTFVGQ